MRKKQLNLEVCNILWIFIPVMSNLLAPISDSCISFATNNIWDKFGQVSEGNIKTFSDTFIMT